MKWLSLFVVVLLCLVVPRTARAQMDVKTDPRIAPLLRQAANGQQDLVIFGRRPVSNMYVNMAVLDKTNKRLCWFTCYGTAYDSVQLCETEYAQIANNIIDPFSFYKESCVRNEGCLNEAIAEYRRLGKLALKDTSYNRRIVYNTTAVKSAHSTLQQLMALEDLFRKECLKLSLFNCPSPSSLTGNREFLLLKSLAGKMIEKPDTAIYYASSPLGFISKIALCRQDSLKMLVYDGQGHVVDSMPVRPGKYTSLLTSKNDVFLLYRGWLALQSQEVQEALRQTRAMFHQQDSGLYVQTYQPENKRQLLFAEAKLKSQQEDIECKINALILPDKERVEQMLQNAYPGAREEISYLSAGMGFAYSSSAKRGNKLYELSSHLGNVMATVSDKKVGLDNGEGAITYYNVDVVNANDYYPFGSLLPERTQSSGNKYRYGFNGKENDNEVKGDGGQQDYGMRVYDPRIGRFLSVDPITRKYPELTPYQFASNRPLDGLDLDGEEWSKIVTYDPISGVTNIHFNVQLKVVNESTAFTDIQNLKIEIQQQFAEAFRNVKDEKSKISYSASVKVQLEKKLKSGDFGVTVIDSKKPDDGFVETGGMTDKTDTQVNAFSVKGDNYLTKTRMVNPAKSVAHDVVHELMHTTGVLHPQDDENTAKDVDLTPYYTSDGKFTGFKLTEGASLDLVVKNIMSYGSLKINGKRIDEYEPDKTKRNKVSPDQAKIASKQIDNDEK